MHFYWNAPYQSTADLSCEIISLFSFPISSIFPRFSLPLSIFLSSSLLSSWDRELLPHSIPFAACVLGSYFAWYGRGGVRITPKWTRLFTHFGSDGYKPTRSHTLTPASSHCVLVVYMCACMYVCMFACMYIYLNKWIDKWIIIYIYVYI